MNVTKIEWTHFPGFTKGMSWNPLRARDKETGKVGWFCTHIAEGCTHCYAESFNRFRGNGREYIAQNRGKVELFLDEKALLAPLKEKGQVCYFTNSMTDLYGVDFGVTYEMLARIYAVMAATPQHLYLNLTKRSKARRQWLTAPDTYGQVRAASRPLLNKRLGCRDIMYDWPLPNVFEGSSIACQKDLHQLDDLMQTPAAYRFVSYEPAIEGVDLSRYLTATHGCQHCGHEGKLQRGWCEDCGSTKVVPLEGSLSWVIIGGESGPHARPFDIAWARQTIQQCRETQVPVFCKQVGSRPVDSAKKFGAGWIPELKLKDKKGGDMSEWPEDIRFREFPILGGKTA